MEPGVVQMAFTVHGIDPEVDRRLAERAMRERTSKNQLVKTLLARAVGMAGDDPAGDDYREFLGTWTAEEKTAFDRAQTDNSQVSDKDWR